MITIRTYIPEDIPILEQLMTDFQRYFVETGIQEKIVGPEFGKVKVAEMIENVNKKQGEIFVACDEGVIMGFAACILDEIKESEKLEYPGYASGTLAELFIDEKYRGSGVGKQLITVAENFLKSRDRTFMKLYVLEANSQARKFYESNGYRTELVVMEKDLS